MKTPKRVSAVKDTRIPAQHVRTIGIDTDRDFLVVGFLDLCHHELKVREYVQDVPTMVTLVRDALAFEPQLIVIESTGQYHLLAHDALKAAGLNIIVVNPLVIAALIRVEGKSDARDAATLARLAASFPLRGSNMPDQLQRRIRLTFKRADEAQDWSRRCRQRLWGHLAACGSTWGRLVTRNAKYVTPMLAAQTAGATVEEIMAQYGGRKTPDEIRAAIVPLTDENQVYARSLFDDHRRFEEKRDAVELDLLMVARQPEVAEVLHILTTVPGVTLSLGLRFIGEVGLDAPQRYQQSEAFCKAIGIAPNQEITGGKVVKATRSRGRTKLRYFLRMSVAGYLFSHRRSWLGRRYVQHKARTGHTRAVAAQAHKVAQWLFACWRDGQPFDEYRAYRHADWQLNPNYERALIEQQEVLKARRALPLDGVA